MKSTQLFRHLPICLSLLVFTGSILPLSTWAKTAPRLEFPTWLNNLKRDAVAENISAALLDKVFADLQRAPKIPASNSNRRVGKENLSDYINRILTLDRINDIRQEYDQNQALKNTAIAFGVAPRLLLAMSAINSDFGKNKTNYPVITTLTAWAYFKPKSPQHRRELLAALQLLNSKQVTLEQLLGNRQGQLGNTLILPSQYAQVAIDQNGNGKIDIWNEAEDQWAAMAKLVILNGWNESQIWGRAVIVPKDADKTQFGINQLWDIGHWQELGVVMLDGSELIYSDYFGAIFTPEGSDGPAFLIYDNYYSLLRIRRSHSYSLATVILSDLIVTPIIEEAYPISFTEKSIEFTEQPIQ
ncbi:MAG: lytic murein transglycosylase [Gammaproteobacteria bacterium]|nr:lytic murein transglycosylase [Gammaproteobacteria bacterium]MDH5729670.1 lytic murein transglycosylase [Gammaproteobacteria bacterium]